MAGTSIGGIIALGLAFKISAQQIAEMMARQGPAIFPLLPAKNVARLVAPPYSSTPIETALNGLLGFEIAAGPLSSASQNVMVITASPGTARI
jgi:hypothetical protein